MTEKKKLTLASFDLDRLTGHTEGDYVVEPLDGNPRALAIVKVGGLQGGVLARIHREDGGLRAIDYADADLFAAAPQLLALLREARNQLNASLAAWEDEEDSVKREHARLIAELRAFVGPG